MPADVTPLVSQWVLNVFGCPQNGSHLGKGTQALRVGVVNRVLQDHSSELSRHSYVISSLFALVLSQPFNR